MSMFLNRLVERSDIFKKMGEEISFKAEKKRREISDLFSKHQHNAMERKKKNQYFIYESMGAQILP
jgi:hypothetical protein